MTLIPQSNFHTQEKEQITNIQWSVRYKRRLPRRIFEAVEGLTEVWLRFALSLYPKDSCRLPFRKKLNYRNNMIMGPTENSWHLGEIATLPRTEKLLKKSGSTVYERLIGSRYVCVREETEGHRGILVKVLGKFPPEHIMTVGGQPFSKDDREELFAGMRYFSYPFPAAKDVQEVLEILRSNSSLIQIFEGASMHINPKSKFWVNEAESHLLIMKRPQCYDAYSEQIGTPSVDDLPYRLTMAYFYKGKLSW